MADTALRSLLWEEFTIRFVMKIMLIYNINGRSYIKNPENSITCLTSYLGFIHMISHLNPRGCTHIRIYMYIYAHEYNFKKPGACYS